MNPVLTTLVLLAYGTLLLDLVVFPIPSEASTLQLLTRDPAGPRKLLDAARGSTASKLLWYFLPTVLGVALVLVPLIATLWPALIEYLLPIDLSAPWIGAGLVVLGRTVGLTCLFQLWGTVQNSGLHTTGLFAFSRNPCLVGMYLFYLGNCFLFPCVVLFVGIILYAWNMHRRVIMEEAHLTQTFGATYRDYAPRVPRYLFWKTCSMSHQKKQNEVTAWFDDKYQRESFGYLRPFQAYPIFLQLLGAKRGESLLDIACGPGLLLQAAEMKELETTGVDIAPSAIELARDHVPQASVHLANVEELLFDDEQFDLVTCIGAMERFLDRKRALFEIRRVAKQDARFCFMVRNANTPSWRLWRRLLRRQNLKGHQDALDLDSWRRLLEESGFAVVETYMDQWMRQRMRRVLRGRPDFSRPEPIAKPLLGLRWAYEFIFILKKA